MDTSKSIATHSLLGNEYFHERYLVHVGARHLAPLNCTLPLFVKLGATRATKSNQCYCNSEREPDIILYLVFHDNTPDRPIIAQFIITERSSGAHTCDTLACPWCSKTYTVTTATWYCSRLRRV